MVRYDRRGRQRGKSLTIVCCIFFFKFRTLRYYMHTASLGRRDGHKPTTSSPRLAEISLSRCTQRFNIIASTMIEKIHIICIFSYEYRFETAKPSLTVKRIGENARWADLTIRLSVVKANSMSARKKYYSAVQNTVIACRCFIVFVTTC